MASDNNSALISFEELKRFIKEMLIQADIPAGDADKIAQLMTQADLQGSDGHGVIRLPQYIKRIRAGGINTRPNIKVVQEHTAMALVDGDNAMGHLAVSYATELAIEKARKAGIAWVGTRRSNHAGPASLYAGMPIRHNMIGVYFAVGNANHLPPWGGAEMLLSTNPIAVGIPSDKEAPIVLDMATTVAAYGKVKAKAKRGEMMPEGWMIDRQGRPLLDPNKSDEGFLLPIGGHKGYGLALIVGILAGKLNGAAMGSDVIDFNKDHITPTNTGQAILVIDLEAFGNPALFASEIDELIQEIRNSEKLPGTERIWLPGEQSHARRLNNQQHGIPIASGLIHELAMLAEELKVSPLKGVDSNTSAH